MVVCVIVCCYNNSIIYNNLKKFFNNLNIEYELFIVNNNIEQQSTLSIKYENVIEGDNTIYEFTGIQKCLNILNKEKYNCFILGTDALFNSPIFYLDFINYDTINFAINNNVCIGNMDCFNKSYKMNDFEISYWLRTSFVLINSNLFKNINYQFITFNNIYDNKNINVDPELLDILNNWLSNDRYKYINNSIKKYTKLTCIFNEYGFIQRIQQHGKVYDFITIYLYNFFQSTMTRNNIQLLINNECYEYNQNLQNILNLTPMEQIKQKNKCI
jgi:hypothetical protein